MRDEHALSWAPPFLVGFVSLIAAEVSSGLLLYSGAGLLRSFTVVLAVLFGSFALGLWSSPGHSRRRPTELVRRKWLLALVSYSLAAAAAGAWEALGGFASATAGRGGGLAFLAGLPLYASGSLLGAMANVTSSGRRVAVAAAGGATAGVVFTGVVLVSSLIPVSMYGLCLVALSGAALIHGRVLDRRPEELLVDEESSLFGPVRVVDRRWGAPRRNQRRLLLADRVIGGTEGDAPLRVWESAAASLVLDRSANDEKVLIIGGSAVVLIERLVEAGVPLTVMERNSVVRRMTVRHFGLPRAADGLDVRDALGVDGLASEPNRYRAVVIDGDARSAGGVVHLPTTYELARMREIVADDGILLLGAGDAKHLVGSEVQAVLRARLGPVGWHEVAVYRASGDGFGRGLLVLGNIKGLPDRIDEMERLTLPGLEPVPIAQLAPDGQVPDRTGGPATVDAGVDGGPTS